MKNNEDKNIILGMNLQRYNWEYRNCKEKLIKYTRKEVEDFDSVFAKPAGTDHVLLKGHKWYLINGTYYQIPRYTLWNKFRNLPIQAQAVCAALLGVIIALIIVLPIIFTVAK